MKHTCAVNLHNVVAISEQGLGRLFCRLERRRMEEVCDALGFALGCAG